MATDSKTPQKATTQKEKPEIPVITGAPIVPPTEADASNEPTNGAKTMTVADLTANITPGAMQTPAVPESPKPSTEIVKVRIHYPKGYEGKRFHEEDSEHEMALPTAEILIKKGIATIISE